MTIEESIQHCEEVAAGKTEQGKCPECAADHKQLAKWLRELVALRAQQPRPLDRSRWERCEFCDKYGLVLAAFDGWSYCNRCGRPLTEAAWSELERRITP